MNKWVSNLWRWQEKNSFGILKNRQVSIKKGLSKKQLLQILKYYDYSDLLKLAQIRRVNIAEDDTIDDLEEKLRLI